MRRALFWIPVIAIAAVVAFQSPKDADAAGMPVTVFEVVGGVPSVLGVGTAISLPDAGLAIDVPPAACWDGGSRTPCRPKRLWCNKQGVSSQWIINPATLANGSANTMNVIVGPSNVKAFGVVPTGLLLEPGDAIAPKASDGVFYVVSTGLADAGGYVVHICETGGAK